MPWNRAIGALFHLIENNYLILCCCCSYLRDGQNDPPNVHGCFSGGPADRLDRVCVGWREVGSVCSNISIAAVRSAAAKGSSSSTLREVGTICSNISIAAAPSLATAAGSSWILPGTSSLSFLP
jgi:hypothetical protein